jgi:hypothetical protein
MPLAPHLSRQAISGKRHDVLAIESMSYLGNQTQQQLRGPQLWKEQVAGKQST